MLQSMWRARKARHDFHKAIAVSGEQFYRTARTSQKNLPKFYAEPSRTGTQDHKTKQTGSELPSLASSTSKPLSKTLPYSFPKPVPQVSSPTSKLRGTKAKTTEKLDAWRTTKQSSFVFENVISEKLGEAEDDSAVMLAPVTTRPRAK